jgi:hypothetical protein
MYVNGKMRPTDFFPGMEEGGKNKGEWQKG